MAETKFKIGNPVSFDDVIIDRNEEENLDPNDDNLPEPNLSLIHI